MHRGATRTRKPFWLPGMYGKSLRRPVSLTKLEHWPSPHILNLSRNVVDFELRANPAVLE